MMTMMTTTKMMMTMMTMNDDDDGDQHNDLHNPTGVRHGCVLWAQPTTRIWELDVSALCTDVGVSLRHAADVLRGRIVALARDQSGHIDDGDAGRRLVRLPDLPNVCRRLAEERGELSERVTQNSTRHVCTLSLELER